MSSITSKAILFPILLTLFFSKHSFSQKVNEDSLWLIIKNPPNDTTQVDALNSLAIYLIGHKQDSAGFPLLEQALTISQNIKYYTGVSQSLLTRGNYAVRKNNWQAAIEAYEMILKEPSLPKDSLRRLRSHMMAHNNLGGIYNRNGDFATALEHRLQSMKNAEKLKADSNSLLIVYCNIASEYRQLNLYDKAEEYLNRGGVLLAGVKPVNRFNFLYELHSLYELKNDTTGIEKVLNEMEAFLTTADLSDYQQLDLNYEFYKLKGMFLRDYKKNYTEAIVAHQQSVSYATKMNATESRLSSLQNLAMSFHSAGMIDKAIPILKEVYNSSMNSNLPFNAKRAAGLLADIYKKKNQFGEAFEYKEKLMALSDSLQSADKRKEVTFLEAKYQNEKKEKEITDLTLTNTQKEIAVEKRNRLLLFGGIGAIALLSILGLLYRNSSQKRSIAEKDKLLKDEQIKFLERQQQVVSLQSMINGQETERTRIAKDLHDGLGGLFSTVKMHYSTLQNDTPELNDNPLYKKTQELISNASEELRRVAHNMMPEVLLKVGLPEALRDMSNNISSGKILSVTFQSYGMDERLSPATEIMLYRIVQELMNNIIKHSSASSAIIQLNRNNNQLSLTIEDNGKGFDTEQAALKQSMGITTVKRRVEYLNGELSIDSQKNVGTTVMIDILLNEN